MNNQDFELKMSQLKSEALAIYKAATPVETGYQKAHIFARDLANGGFEIVVDTDYVEFTTDPWTKGNNPNEGWELEAGKLVKSIAKSKLSARSMIKPKRSDG